MPYFLEHPAIFFVQFCANFWLSWNLEKNANARGDDDVGAGTVLYCRRHLTSMQCIPTRLPYVISSRLRIFLWIPG